MIPWARLDEVTTHALDASAAVLYAAGSWHYYAGNVRQVGPQALITPGM